MIGAGFYKALQEKLGGVAGIAAGAGIVLHLLGYFSMRFWLRSVGLRPDLDLLSEAYIFEGASFLLFLLATTGPLLGALWIFAGLWVLSRRVPGLGSLVRGMEERFANLSAASVAGIGSVWALVSVQVVLHQVLSYRHLVHEGVPCDPAWLRAVAFSDGRIERLFFAFLLVIPLPTLWAVRRSSEKRALRPITVLLAALALVQIVLIPINYGVLVGHAYLPQLVLTESAKEKELDEKIEQMKAADGRADTVTSAAEGDSDGFVGRMWELYRSEEHVHLLTIDDSDPPRKRIRVLPTDELGMGEIVAVDSLYDILTEGQTCP